MKRKRVYLHTIYNIYTWPILIFIHGDSILFIGGKTGYKIRRISEHATILERVAQVRLTQLSPGACFQSAFGENPPPFFFLSVFLATRFRVYRNEIIFGPRSAIPLYEPKKSRLADVLLLRRYLYLIFYTHRRSSNFTVAGIYANYCRTPSYYYEIHYPPSVFENNNTLLLYIDLTRGKPL